VMIGSSLHAQSEFRDHPLLLFGFPPQFTAEVELADVDGDGDLDILTANGRHWAQQDRVYLNVDRGRPLEARDIGGISASYVIRAGDFDGDGDPDLVVIHDTLPAEVFGNDGTGNFLRTAVLDTGGTARGARLADVDGDGFLDLLIARRRGSDRLHRGNASGTFEPGEDLPGTEGPSTDLAIGDLDSDGDADLVIARRDGEPSLISINDGRGGFETHTLPESSGDHRKAVLADLDGDGDMDIALGSVEGGIRLYLGDGEGAFVAGETVAPDAGGVQALVGFDLDADGDIDLVQGAETEPNSVHWNDGKGRFTTEALPVETADTYGIAVGDLNGDGAPDLVFANSESANEILLGTRGRKEDGE